MRTKKLFQILDTQTSNLLPDFYSDKMHAKKDRTKLNGQQQETEGKFRYIVTLGPEHNRHPLNKDKRKQ